MAPFQPGDVVVCVDARPTVLPDGPEPWLVKGQFYRVSEMMSCGRGRGLRVFGVQFASVHDWFRADRFRKIDDEVTEEFREQLAKLPVRERVS